ncbi:MAG: hypothetical protein QOK15_325 [Nocardioidaceae bacterium]|jgi:hypothetical protein|nr:hypothetical protein [Nocardioidaceae bacterium]
MESASDLTQRYRGPGRVQRVVALVIVTALVVSGVGLLTWTVIFESNPSVRSQLTAFDVHDEHEAVATITVVRESEFTKATCQLQAISADHAIVGEIERPVLDGPATQTLQVQIRTERRAATVNLLGCTAPDQSRPG